MCQGDKRGPVAAFWGLSKEGEEKKNIYKNWWNRGRVPKQAAPRGGDELPDGGATRAGWENFSNSQDQLPTYFYS